RRLAGAARDHGEIDERRLARRGDDRAQQVPARLRGRFARARDGQPALRRSVAGGALMRVTEGMRYHSITRVLSGLATRQAQAAQRALTGERVGAPADDPIGAAQLLRLRSSVTEMNDYRRAIARSEEHTSELQSREN